MARRKKASRIQKHESKIALKWTGASNSSGTFSDSVYIDVAQCASIMNRKLIRQGNMFRIKNMRFYTQDTTPNVDVRVAVIPRVWPVFNGYRKARALWHKMNASLTDSMSPTIYPKYHDYKVFMNESHYDNHVGGGDTNLLPIDADGNAVPAGDWDYSRYADSGSTSDNYVCHVLGNHKGSTGSWTSVGIVEAYSQSRAYPQVDSTVTDDLVPADIATSPWAKLFGDDDQTQDVTGFLMADNDTPPYSRADYTGGAGSMEGGLAVHRTRLQSIGQTSGTATFSVPAFDAPLGLIRIELDATGSMSIDDLHITFEYEVLGEM